MDLPIMEGRLGKAGGGRLPGNLPAAAAVYEELRGRICRLQLLPDTTLSRLDLAKEFGVSQTPVREALQHLEQDGLVKIFPQSRTVVSRIDLPQLYESHFLRVAVESEAMRRLAANPDPAILAKMRSLVTLQEALADDLDQLEMFNELDETFHRTLLEGVGHGNLYYLLRSRSGHMARARRLNLPREGKLKTILEGHHAMLDGLASGSEEQAAGALKDHLSGTIAELPIMRQEHPEFFRD